MPHIDDFSFGRMAIDGRVFTHDVCIVAGRVLAPWRRKQGHVFQLADLGKVLAAKPEVLVLGTGASGMARPAEGLEQALAQNGIRAQAAPTGQAAQLFNDLAAQGADVAGAFHLTC